MDWGDEQATLVDSSSDLDQDYDVSEGDDNDSDTDSDSGTDDGVDAGLEIRGLYFGDISLSLLPAAAISGSLISSSPNRPSDKVVQKLARLMILTVDPNAPTKLSPKLSKKLATSKRVIQLSRKSKAFTQKLRKKYHVVLYAPPHDPWFKAKKQVDAALHRKRNNRRNRMLEKACKRYFQIADTSILEAQFADSSLTASDKDVKPPAPIPERSNIVRLTYKPIVNMTDHEKYA
ncbi:MAG: hypothetical protein Q9217_000700 [Psora testacea]